MDSKTSSNLAPENAGRLLFWSRVAFICNIFFLLAFSIQLTDWVQNQDISSTIALIGYVMGFVINPFVNIAYLIIFIVSKRKLRLIPSWLITANILFLVMQILYIFYLNDTKHS
jgi:hypothetical protein